MGHKVRPDSFRTGIIKQWASRWFFKGDYPRLLEQDEIIRNIIARDIKQGGVSSVYIERTAGECKVVIKASRPGLIIGRGGEGINKLRKNIVKALNKLSKEPNKKHSLNLSIEEIKRTEVSATVIAQQVASDLEKRMRFRRVVKRQVEQIIQNRDVKGVKIRVSGRLDGAEIARSEWFAKGTLPLQTLRADIDYGTATAFTIYGTIGIKVWINKGEIFIEDKEEDNS